MKFLIAFGMLAVFAGADCPPEGSPDAGPDADSTGDAVVRFTGTARTRASFGECLSNQMPFVGFAPATGEPGPLFVWTVGTFATYDSEDVIMILRNMAANGFVAVSPSYDNSIVNGCPNLREKTMCIFDADQPESLVATLCSRSDVDCERGIVVGGHSQGSGIALLANNYDERVRAAFALGMNCDYLFDLEGDGLCNPAGAVNDTDCLLDSATEISADRVRIIAGEADEFGAPNAQDQYQNVSGRSCPPGELDCLAADGSGWYRVPNEMVEDGVADHCFIVNSLEGEFCPGTDAAHPFDVGWAPPAELPWSLITNLDWLAGFADAAR